ncbi:MAG: hypothetical protein A3J46_04405 [Candidatus Yanofskybacteria bacterium RIFCSPHIGHO2_02_FULL_41_11]|uniref:Type II secretion system protein GspH n=1 Tax=Candidatus Yanofskybacteria bacterium RIFCSPHIGHO2_02_FULL_41_11 TaxID=1802675 RepID=A0A1F8F6K7_9BACT|nr:MAG: hypothetical protein A3J46_04405 [Candidatus Yanofskybacteria bacterium RIFCSPHIGHO2_02_FULL_41_11]
MIRLNNNDYGFTLIEILIVVSIIAFTSVALIENFSTSRVNVDRATNQLVSDLRTAQSHALSTRKTEGLFRCGYGITRLNSNSYAIYAGRDSSSGNCQSNRNYNSSQNPIVLTRVFTYQSISTYPTFNDIFFEPPGLKTYINNTTGDISPEKIFVRINDTDCVNSFSSTRCKLVCVYTSGKIEINRTSNSCPGN